ncbi:MAG: chromate transporter [Negativicutes bacterium]|nr:chromate transporter [Negativicutes bacterium]
MKQSESSSLTSSVGRISLWDIMTSYLQIALSSFGGGLSAWAQIVIVEKRHWMSDEEFLSGVALCRVLPGPNSVNFAVYLGSRLRGFPGVLAALIGMITIPFFIVVFLGIAYFQYQYMPGVQAALRGMAAVAVGMTLGMGSKLALRHSFTPATIFIMVAAFVAIGLLRWPLLPVMAVLIPLSVGLSWRGAAEGPKKAGEENEQ